MRSLTLLAAMLCATPALAQRVQIDISGANFKPLPIAYPAPKGTGDAAVLKAVS